MESSCVRPYLHAKSMSSGTRLTSIPAVLNVVALRDLLGREGQVEVQDAVGRESIHDGIGDGHRRRHGRKLPDPLHPKRIRGRRCLPDIQVDGWDFVGAGDGIVQQTSSQRLAVRLRSLPQLTLGRSPGRWPHAPALPGAWGLITRPQSYRCIAQKLHFSRGAIDFDDRDMGGETERILRQHKADQAFQPRFHAGW